MIMFKIWISSVIFENILNFSNIIIEFSQKCLMFVSFITAIKILKRYDKGPNPLNNIYD